MADKVQIKFQTNANEVKNKVDGLQKSVDRVQKTASVKAGMSKLLGIGGSAIGGNMGTALNGLAGGISGLSAVVSPATAGLASLAGITKLLYDTMEKSVQAGMETARENERLNAKLSKQLGAQGIDAKPLVDSFQLQSANGVLSAEELTGIFLKMVPVLHGNTKEAESLVKRLHDIQSATGVSGESLASLISRVQEAGEVDQKTLKQLERQNIPIIRKLAEVYNVSADEVAEAVKKDKHSAQTFVNALLEVTEVYDGTASALSNTTEGARKTMEALKGIANKSASDAYNDILRDYYNNRADFWKNKKDDKDFQDALKEEASLVAETEIFKREMSDLWDDFLQKTSSFVADFASFLGTNNSLQANSFKRDIGSVVDAGELLGDESATLEQLKQYRERLEDIYTRFTRFIRENADSDITPALEKQLDQIQNLFELYDSKIKIKEQRVAIATLDAQKAQEEAERAEQEAQATLKREQERRESEELQREYAKRNGTAEDRLNSFNLVSFDELENAIQALTEKAKNGELDKLGLSLLGEYNAILEAHNKELADATKEEERIRREQADALREENRKELNELDKYHKRNAIQREFDESAEYNNLYDKMEAYAKRLLEAGFNPEEAENMMQNYLAKLNLETWQDYADPKKISANGLNSIKDFKYDENKVQERALKTQEAIEKLTGKTNDLIQAQTRVMQLQQAIAG